MLDVFIHHQDYFSTFNYVASAKHWLQQTGVVPMWHTTMSSGLAIVSNGPLALSLNRLLAYAGTSALFATALVEWLCLSLAALCMYSLLRLHGLGRGGALSAAVLYQYFTTTWWALECYPSALLVASLLLCELYEQRRSPLALYANAVLVAVFSTTAIPHGVLIIFAFQGLLAIVRLMNGTGRGFALATLGSWFLGLAMAAPALLPTARDAAQSYRLYFIRASIDLQAMSLRELVWFVANVGFQFQNLGPPLLIAATLGVSAIHFLSSKLMRTLYFVCAFCVLFLGVLTPNQELTTMIPVIGKLFNAFDMQRNFILPFTAAFFSGVCVDALGSRQDSTAPSKLQVKIFGLLAFFLAIWLIGGHRFREYSLLAATGLGTYFWISLRGSQALREKWAPRFFWGLAAFCVFVLVQSHVKDVRRMLTHIRLPVLGAAMDDDLMRSRANQALGESPENTRVLVQTLRDKTWKGLSRAIDIDVLNFPNKSFFAANEIPTIFFFDNTSPARSREFYMWMIDDIRTTNPKTYHKLWHTSTYSGADGTRFNTAMLSLAGVEWIVEPKGMLETRFEPVWAGERLALYRNDQAFPKAFAVFGLEVLADKDAMASRLMTATVSDLRHAALVRPEDVPDLPPGYFADLPSGSARAEVSVVRYTPNEVLVQVEANANAMLVLGDTNHPVWKASVDGVDTHITPAYNMFRMVPVPKGKHLVRFYVQDNLYRAGILLSGAILTALTLWLLWAAQRHRRMDKAAR